MQLVFRTFLPSSASDSPLPGELHLRLAAQPANARIGLTLTALQQGPAGFVRGVGPVERIVIQADPTLDDMLAALVLEEQLCGREFPKDCPLAHYVAALAGGLNPAEGVPTEELIEGVFAHYRHGAGDMLTNEEWAAKFLADWKKLAPVLREALLEPSKDPFKQSLLGGRTDFRAESLFLRNDHTVYEQDVRNGERLLMRLPDVPGEVPALRLNEPRSVLFKFWARTDPTVAVPEGRKGYQFLAVLWGEKNWFFSTDPLDRHKIGTLAEPLQAIELKTSTAAGADPWYDGQRHGFTIVCPPRAGTALSADEVWDVVKKWGQARRFVERSWYSAGSDSALAAGAAAVLAVGIAVGAYLLSGSGQTDSTSPTGQFLISQLVPKSPMVVSRDPTEDFAEAGLPEEAQAQNLRRIKFARGVPSQTITPEKETALRLDKAKPGAAIQVWLESSSLEQPPAGMKIRLPNGKTQELTWQGKERFWTSTAFRAEVSDPTVELTVPNPDPKADSESLERTLRGWPNPNEVHLHVLTIGVSQYTATGGPRELKYCAKDALALCAAFKQMEANPLFTKVHAEALTNPTSGQIIDKLEEFRVQIAHDKKQGSKPPAQLAVVTFAGPGKVFDGDRFVFLTSNFDDRLSTAVTWDQMRGSLGRLGCTTLVMLDCCHSGQAAAGRG